MEVPKRTYTIENPSEVWHEKFLSIQKDLQSIFKEKALRIEHVGSTSIPNMPAKPIVDVVLEVPALTEIESELLAVSRLGYRIEPNLDSPSDLIFLKENAEGIRTENIHVYPQGDDMINRYIFMRDFFIRFPEYAEKYKTLKQTLYTEHPDSYLDYKEGKRIFLENVEQLARKWKDKD